MVSKLKTIHVFLFLSFLFSQTTIQLPTFSSGSYNSSGETASLSGTTGQVFSGNTSSNLVIVSSGLWGSVSSMALGVDDLVPLEFTLSKAYPNPFNPTVNIDFTIPEATDISIQIFDLMGKAVFTHQQAFSSPGNYNFKWNGLTNSGTSIASGVYLVNINHKSNLYQQKITFLK